MKAKLDILYFGVVVFELDGSYKELSSIYDSTNHFSVGVYKIRLIRDGVILSKNIDLESAKKVIEGNSYA